MPAKNKHHKIIVTGGAGFIGSNLISALNSDGIDDILVVDRLDATDKWQNLNSLSFTDFVDRDDFPPLLDDRKITGTETIFHLGACTNTEETDASFLFRVNTLYSKLLFEYASENQCRLIYASSAATYGSGSHGYKDAERNLFPLNCYGYSKHLFDEWARDSARKPAQWAGLKFFNVYGPRESHKGRMASVAYHGYHQIVTDGILRLFKSYDENYPDGGQKRDFIYITDAVKAILFFFKNPDTTGIFNIGTGRARTFLDLGSALFQALGTEVKVEFIDMPDNLRHKYQYSTQADIQSLRAVGFSDSFISLEDGITDYVQNYLSKKREDW